MRNILGRSGGKIDNIGPVELGLNLKDPEYLQHGLLDISVYENVHRVMKEGADSVVSPQECIEKLRATLMRAKLSQTLEDDARKLASATTIHFKGCIENNAGQMVCNANIFTGNTQFIVTRHNVSQPWKEIPGDIYTDCQKGFPKEVCHGQYTDFTNQPIDTTPSVSSAVGQAAIYNASTAALSEAAGDILYINGLVSPENAARVKRGTQLLMVYLTGSIYSSAAAWGVSKGLEKTGLVSSKNANWAGQAVGIGINLGTKLFTPTGAAATAVGFFASKAGVMAEKAIVQACTEKRLPQ
jgi:hypothetical protein